MHCKELQQKYSKLQQLMVQLPVKTIVLGFLLPVPILCVLFFDKLTPSNEPKTTQVWVYDLRTNQNFTLVENPLNDESLTDFIQCYGDNLAQRKQNERFKCFNIDEILKRDKTNLDISWIKEQSVINSENIASPDEILEEIKADIAAALGELEQIKV